MSKQSRYLDDFYVAGMRYWDGAKVLDKLAAGKRLELRAEPDNPYDPNAVELCRKGVKLGYIPRDRNALAAKLLRFGHGEALEARVIQVDPQADVHEQVRVGLYIVDKTQD